MADYGYTNVPSNLKRFLTVIQTSGIPSTLTTKTLESLGFKSKNDRSIISVLTFIGFISADKVPTEIWKRYRDKSNAPKVLGQAIQSAYKDLFLTYPDAYRKDNEALKNFFSAKTTVGGQSTSAMVSTFKALCDQASFDVLESEEITVLPKETSNLDDNGSIPSSTITYIPPQVQNQIKSANGLTLNINIELHLPATQEGDVYDKLFEALKKHLLQG